MIRNYSGKVQFYQLFKIYLNMPKRHLTAMRMLDAQELDIWEQNQWKNVSRFSKDTCMESTWHKKSNPTQQANSYRECTIMVWAGISFDGRLEYVLFYQHKAPLEFFVSPYALISN